MADDICRFLTGLGLRPGATAASIAESEKHLGAMLPPDYVEFLRLADGGEGFVGNNAYVVLCAVKDLESLNRSYNVDKYAPGLLIFGSDGGGEAYGFDKRSAQWAVVRVPFVGMSWTNAKPMGSTFGAFLQRLWSAE